MKKTLIFAALVAALALTACKKKNDSTPEPTPEPQTVTRVATEIHKVNMGMMGMVTSSNFTWENGVLTSVCDTINLGIMTQTYKNNMIYENGLLVRVDEENGQWNYFYTYEDGLMTSFINLSEGDTSAWGKITSHTADGLVEEYISYSVASSTTKKTRWTLTWENGDAVTVVEDILEPEDVAGTHTYNYTYDDKPNVRTGNPLGYAIFDGSGSMVARRQSKHNLIGEGYTCNYNDKGYLISYVMENDSTFYNYIEQTLR